MTDICPGLMLAIERESYGVFECDSSTEEFTGILDKEHENAA